MIPLHNWNGYTSTLTPKQLKGVKGGQGPRATLSEMDLQVIGAKIRDLRVAKGWSQAALARRCDLTQQHISKIEKGITGKLSTLMRVAEELDCEVMVHLADPSTEMVRVALPLPVAQLAHQLDDMPSDQRWLVARLVQVLPRLPAGWVEVFALQVDGWERQHGAPEGLLAAAPTENSRQ